MNNKIKKWLDFTTIKFIIVGIINTVVGTSVMFILYNVFSVGYWMSSAANYIIGSIVSYFLNKYFTFRNREKSFKQIILFIINISLCYLIAYGIAKPMVAFILNQYNEKIQGNISMLVGMGLFVILNYFGQRLVVFRQSEKKVVSTEL